MSDDKKKGRHTSTIQNELLLASLTKFFMRPINLKQILQIVNGTSMLSLRLIDWFVTNYSKKNNTIIVKEKKTEFINVYIHYRSQLRAYSKHLFDPFRRQDKIAFFYDKDHSFNTTIGQLNFFRWAIENNILNYITENLDVIVADMNSSANPSAKETSGKSKSPRASPKAPKREVRPSNLHVAKGERVLRFD